METSWRDDPLSKAYPARAYHPNDIRAAIEAALPAYNPPWGRGNRVDTSTPIAAQQLLDLRTAMLQVWAARGVAAGPMLWTQTVPGSGPLGGIIRATHFDDLRRWFNTSETYIGSQPVYQFPQVRPLLFGINPSWAEWQSSPQYTNAAMLGAIKAAGATCIRAGIDWNCIEPDAPVNGQHTYYWNAQAAPNPCVQARDYDADVGNAPNWATGNTSGLMPPDSAHVADFQAFVTAMAQHFLGQIRHYEFNNEPDQGTAWHNPSPDAATYVPFLQTFSNAVKAVDPMAWVSTGAVANLNSGGSGRTFITGIYTNGGQQYFDAMAGHPYATPDVDTAGIAWLRGAMDGHGDRYKPIWLTEYGWNVNVVGEQNQATYLQNSLNDLVAAGSVTIATFQLIADVPNTPMGLYTADLRTARPAYSTFSNFQKPTT